ncbi:BZ3500_MvSof-1268-A1-R1_Chr6-3g08779 [Microbotryum saponariae]|uniref:BZ3500_MvSof-1268-A1-R1_Chr6-3g08779 protein n=1 Tax=Microbotryum saponariae TaxID=289078 RepID=A0A2X0LPI9_9BASI|nr:BZ3500_MvSof-1268-A1-R1_Chr6-3g08779 [Microbotryum saponariae]SDA07380.1 BZ3501_MvSof-1269-A2-R1_Chr6-2g08482 [Microbotryum saponariae]
MSMVIYNIGFGPSDGPLSCENRRLNERRYRGERSVLGARCSALSAVQRCSLTPATLGSHITRRPQGNDVPRAWFHQVAITYSEMSPVPHASATRGQASDAEVDHPTGEETPCISKGASVSEGSNASTSDPATSTTPAKKKPKTDSTGQNGCRRKGKLRAFQNMPIDILLEIALHLAPATLISLARAARIFARLLLHDAHRHVWFAAMERTQFPHLESQATRANPHSIRYIARIVFDPCCQFCDRRRKAPLDRALLIRVCKECRQAQVKSSKRLSCYRLHPRAEACSLVAYDFAVPRRGPEAVYNLDEISAVNSALFHIDTASTLQNPIDQKSLPLNTAYYLPKPSGDPALGKRALEDYLKDRAEYVDAVQSDESSLARYEKVLKALKKQDSANVAALKSQVKAQRLKDITQRLVEAGVDPRDVPVEHPFLNIARRMPKESWVTAKDRLLQASEHNKTSRLRDERGHEFAQRLATFLATQMTDHALTMPALNDVLFNVRVKAMWQPAHVIVDDSSFSANQEALRQVVIELCAPRRLSYFCMAADAMNHLRCGVDATLFEKARRLEPFRYALEDNHQGEALSEEELLMVDAVLADPHIHFTCCAKSWTYVELEAHVAENNAHQMGGALCGWKNFDKRNIPYDKVKVECSREICRIVRRCQGAAYRPTFIRGAEQLGKYLHVLLWLRVDDVG